MRTTAVPSLLTPGRIADALAVPLPRVLYILATRPQIRPAARAGTLRLYDSAAVAAVRHELNAISARNVGKGGPHPVCPPHEPLAVNSREAARLLAISPRTLWSLTKPRGPIACIRLGRAVRYSLAALREFLDNQQACGETHND